ncbi:MAG: hypothetical protein GY917_00970, partial [Planctomycetaceae bacterium]|nr:hypothetical protein [Planctomycetaceae bacterium]
RQLIDVWRFDNRIAVASKFDTEIVHGNEQDILFSLGVGSGRAGCQAKDQEYKVRPS